MYIPDIHVAGDKCLQGALLLIGESDHIPAYLLVIDRRNHGDLARIGRPPRRKWGIIAQCNQRAIVPNPQHPIIAP